MWVQMLGGCEVRGHLLLSYTPPCSVDTQHWQKSPRLYSVWLGTHPLLVTKKPIQLKFYNKKIKKQDDSYNFGTKYFQIMFTMLKIISIKFNIFKKPKEICTIHVQFYKSKPIHKVSLSSTKSWSHTQLYKIFLTHFIQWMSPWKANII